MRECRLDRGGAWRFVFTLALLLGTLVVAVQAASAQPKESRIGMVIELTGPFAIFGIPQRNNVQMLAEQINARGGIKGVPIKLIVYDNQSKVTESLVVAKKLVEQDNVLAIIGGGTTPTTLPMLPYIEEVGVPLLSMGSSNSIIEPVEKRRWAFKTPNVTSNFVSVITKFLLAKGWTKLAFMSVNNAYGDVGRAEFEKAAAKLGLNVVAWEKFGHTDSDMKPQFTKIRSLAPQAIVVWAIPPTASMVDKSHKELGLTIPLVHDQGASTLPAWIKLAGGAAEGAYVETAKVTIAEDLPASDPQRDMLLTYRRAYEQRFAEPASYIGAVAYDALLLLVKAIETGGGERGKIRDALERITGFPGISAMYNLSPRDHNGVSEKDLMMAQVRNGKIVLLQP